MDDFRLHTTLAGDCHVLASWGLSEVLLNRNALLPWFILVPRVTVIELCDLEVGQRRRLDAEIDAVCALLRDRFPVTKLNVAAIGNLVPQLHVHVIGRHPDDPCWPGVVWGNLSEGPAWDAEALRDLGAALAAIDIARAPDSS